MKIHQIRNATMRISYAGKTILTDPVLGPKHGFKSFAGIEKNPTVNLPMPAEEVIKDIDMVIVSHLHDDHFDEGAKQMLPKDTPILCQTGDYASIIETGFSNVTPVDTDLFWENIHITRTPGWHATNEKWMNLLGTVSGFVFKAENEPVLYWTGDTILCDDVKNTIKKNQPDTILTHSCGAQIMDSGPIIMDEKQTIEVCRLAPTATVIATHMEALDHGTVSRNDLRDYARKKGIGENRLLIPYDGQILEL